MQLKAFVNTAKGCSKLSLNFRYPVFKEQLHLKGIRNLRRD